MNWFDEDAIPEDRRSCDDERMRGRGLDFNWR